MLKRFSYFLFIPVIPGDVVAVIVVSASVVIVFWLSPIRPAY